MFQIIDKPHFMKPIRIATVSLLIFIASFPSVFAQKEKIKAKVPKGFVYIPSGSFLDGKDTISVDAFWMLKTEVTNWDYQEFLYDLQNNGNIKALEIAAIDTLKWRTPMAYNEPYATYYHRHPAFKKYPIVNISYAAAQLYCEWLAGKISDLNKGRFIVTARLPSRLEWTYAASNGGKTNPYSWEGEYTRNKKGAWMANYFRLNEENADSVKTHTFYDSLNEHIMAPSQSYFPSKFGLYNMNGNVSEMIQEKGIAMGGHWKSKASEIKNTSSEKYSESACHLGFRPVITFSKK